MDSDGPERKSSRSWNTAREASTQKPDWLTPSSARASATSTSAACGFGAMTAAYSSTSRTNRRARTTACAACALRVDADSADAVGGINQLYFVFSQGVRGLGATQNGQDLASRINGRVDFSKMELTLSRLQPLPLPAFSALIAAYGQYAMTPLLVSEMCGYGGRLFGRGFDPSQFISDSCFEALFELRYDIPIQLPALTQTQLYGFFDHGWLHNLASVPGTFTSVDAASFGGGLRLGWLNAVTADLSVTQVAQGQGLLGTTALPSVLGAGPRRNTRFFFILSARL